MSDEYKLKHIWCNNHKRWEHTEEYIKLIGTKNVIVVDGEECKCEDRF